jgi:hypothetical protein
VERDGVVIKRQSFGPIAGLNFAERQMPAKMAWIYSSPPLRARDPKGNLSHFPGTETC